MFAGGRCVKEFPEGDDHFCPVKEWLDALWVGGRQPLLGKVFLTRNDFLCVLLWQFPKKSHVEFGLRVGDANGKLGDVRVKIQNHTLGNDGVVNCNLIANKVAIGEDKFE